jgi:hypothetical protein
MAIFPINAGGEFVVGRFVGAQIPPITIGGGRAMSPILAGDTLISPIKRLGSVFVASDLSFPCASSNGRAPNKNITAANSVPPRRANRFRRRIFPAGQSAVSIRPSGR